MDRLFSKHVNAIPVCISSRLYWLLFLICLITITGCATRATPDTWNLKIQDDAPLPIPKLSLVRHVVPEVGTKSRTIIVKTNNAVREVGESRFGDPGEVADPSCIYKGLKEALPGIDIVPTATFWGRVATTTSDIQLPDLFVAPQLDRLRAIQADVMVIAYHTKIDLESSIVTDIFNTLYDNTDKETAANIVIDLRRKTIIHGSKISFENQSGFGYIMFIPVGRFTLEPPDICNTVGRQAGAAIAEAMPGRTVRALVVVAGEDPYEAADLMRQ